VSGFLERLAELCAIDSPTGDTAACDACALLLAGFARDAGIAVEVAPSPVGLHLVASARGRGEGRVLLIGHHDTVFPHGTAADRPVREQAGRARGPGVADMKGGLLVALEALARLAADPEGAHGLVELHSVPDEEGRNVAPYTLERMRGADASLCFECGRASGAIVTARKAGTWLTLTAHGRPAHAGTELHGFLAYLMKCTAAAMPYWMNGSTRRASFLSMYWVASKPFTDELNFTA